MSVVCLVSSAKVMKYVQYFTMEQMFLKGGEEEEVEFDRSSFSTVMEGRQRRKTTTTTKTKMSLTFFSQHFCW